MFVSLLCMPNEKRKNAPKNCSYCEIFCFIKYGLNKNVDLNFHWYNSSHISKNLLANLNHTEYVSMVPCICTCVMLDTRTHTHTLKYSSGKLFNNKCRSEKDTENIRHKTGKSMCMCAYVRASEWKRVKTNFSRC